MVKIDNVKKSFGKNEILKGVSMQVNQGEVTVIIGPSGSGKTTSKKVWICFSKLWSFSE